MKLFKPLTTILTLAAILISMTAAHAFFGGKFKTLTPQNDQVMIPMDKINDGKAHYFETRAEDGIMVKFFVVKSHDGVIRAAVDACDVCYKSGKGYVQEGDVMVCTNCGLKFATDRINEVKGGCNPAPLERTVQNGNLIIAMAQINANAWYCKYKK